MSTRAGEPARDHLSIREATAGYRISRQHLVDLLTAGQVRGFKIKGRRVMEWRVCAADLRELGYAPRHPAVDLDQPAPAAEQHQLRQLERKLRHQTRRAEQMDGRLGHALLTIGALRGQLRRAGLDPEGSFGTAAADEYPDPPVGAGDQPDMPQPRSSDPAVDRSTAADSANH